MTEQPDIPTTPPIPPQEGFLRLPQVLKLIPVSRATWWAGVKTGRFPRSVKLAPRITAWRMSDIRQFIDNPKN